MFASMLARMTRPEFPVAVGVLFAERRPTYDGTIGAQQRAAKERAGGARPRKAARRQQHLDHLKRGRGEPSARDRLWRRTFERRGSPFGDDRAGLRRA